MKLPKFGKGNTPDGEERLEEEEYSEDNAQAGEDEGNLRENRWIEKLRQIQLTPRFVVGIAVIVVLLIVVAAAIGLFGGSSQSIALPSGSGESGPATVEEEQEFTLTDADVTLENVQQVIEDLKRPDSYSASIDNTVYWSEDWSTCQVNQYVRDGYYLTEFYNTKQDVDRYEMIVDDTYYSWRVGNKKYYTARTGTVTADQTSMIPTYETIVDADPDEIADAGIKTIGGAPCIFCEMKDEASGYTITYYVSTVSGLLARAEYTRDGQLVRSVAMTSLDQSEPDSKIFELPDGSNPLTEQEWEEEQDARTGEESSPDDLIQPNKQADTEAEESEAEDTPLSTDDLIQPNE